MKSLFAIVMGILMSHVVIAQHIKSDTYKRNHKLNKSYLQDLRTKKVSANIITEVETSSLTNYITKNRKFHKKLRLPDLLMIPIESSKCYHYICRNRKLQASRSDCAACDKLKK